MFSQYTGWIDHIPVCSVYTFSTFTFLQLMNSSSAGSLYPVERSSRPRIAGVATIFPGPTSAMSVASVAEMNALYPLHPVALPTHLRKRVIRLHFRRPVQRRTLLQPQCHAPLRSASAPVRYVSRRHHHLATAKHGAALDRLLDRQSVFRLAVARRTLVLHAQRDLGLRRHYRLMPWRGLGSCRRLLRLLRYRQSAQRRHHRRCHHTPRRVLLKTSLRFMLILCLLPSSLGLAQVSRQSI